MPSRHERKAAAHRVFRSIAIGGVIGASVAVMTAICCKFAFPYDVPLDLAIVFGSPAGFLAGGVIALFRLVDGGRGQDGYHRLLRFVVGMGIITFVGGVLWIFVGAGIYGSPLSGLFSSSDNPDANWGTWILCVVVAGPLAVLPCALLERQRRHWGVS